MNKTGCFLLVCVLICFSIISCKNNNKISDPGDITQFVDPLIGTAHCRWFHVAPGANPFGMAKPGPSTNGELITIPGALDSVEKGYRSYFDKEDETLDPGYYSVILKDYGIKAEVTSTNRVSYHRYTFPANEQSHILFDIGNKQGESGNVKDARVTFSDNERIEGFVETMPEYVKKYQTGSNVKMFFSAIIDRKPESYGIFHGSVTEPGNNEATGVGAGLYLTFSTTDNESITIKAGLSYTSIDNARLNLETEANNLSFDEALEQTHDNWNSYLGRIRVEGKSLSDKIKFYTGTENKPEHNFYNSDAIWGAQWNLIQLWTLVYPEYISDFIKSQLLVYSDAGWLGDGTEGIHGYGFGQDEDQGQLGAWYVMSGIGLFDVKGLTDTKPTFGIGTPLFDKITISLNNKYYAGKQFVIETENNSPDNFYIQSMNLNGTDLTETFIPFSEVVNGGKMVIKLGNVPRDQY